MQRGQGKPARGERKSSGELAGEGLKDLRGGMGGGMEQMPPEMKAEMEMVQRLLKKMPVN